MSKGAFDNCKRKFSDMTGADPQRLTALKDENAKLEKPLAEQMLGPAAMKKSVS
ncbi:MAG: hypothetical protein ACJA1L_003072 [Paracoccaceae bacterium]|jgi:hypothetical protein